MEPSPSLPPDPQALAPDAEPPSDRAPAPPPVSLPGHQAVAPTRRWFNGLRPGRQVLLAVGAALLAVGGAAFVGTGYVYEPMADEPPMLDVQALETEALLKASVNRARRRDRQLAARVKAAAPRGVFIVVDQTHNRLYLKRDEEVLLEAVCSAGSGMVLKESGGKQREWVFDTPRGRFEVLSMAERPVWRKPDWAFIEEGQPIPRNPADRLEYGTLGEFALYFGNGYMIHGTLYERLLGRAVSHGCIRVGRDDLRKVWANARLGTPIFIY